MNLYAPEVFDPSGRVLLRRSVGAAAILVLALFLARAPLALVAAVAAATPAVLVLIRRPWLAWCILAVALPFSSAVVVDPLSLTDVLLAGAIFLWFVDGVRRGSLALEVSALPCMVAVYLAMLLFTSLQALNLVEAAGEVIKWTEVFVTVWLVGQTLSVDQKRWLVACLLAGGVLQALLGVYQFIFQVGPDAFILLGRFMRAAGTFSQPNPYAGYLGLTLPVAVSLSLWAGQRSLNTIVDRAGNRLIPLTLQAAAYTSAALAIGIGLIASWSRGGWVGALIALVVIIVFRSSRAVTWSLIILCALGIAFLAGGLRLDLIPATIAGRLADLPAYFGVGIAEIVDQPVTDENFAVIERLAHWIAAIRMWETAPWLGVGPGNYATVYPEVSLPLWQEPLGHAHNIYLNVLAETGLVGFVIYLVFWSFTVVWLWRKKQRFGTDIWQGALAVGVVGVIVHLSVHNIFDNLFVQGIYLHVALWLAATDNR